MSNKRFLKQGAPLLAFMLFGSLGLSQFIAGRNEMVDMAKGKRSLTTREFDLEEDYKKTMKKLNLDAGYEIKRIERPSDETTESDYEKLKNIKYNSSA